MQLDNWGRNGFTGITEKLAGFRPSFNLSSERSFFFFFKLD